MIREQGSSFSLGDSCSEPPQAGRIPSFLKVARRIGGCAELNRHRLAARAMLALATGIPDGILGPDASTIFGPGIMRKIAANDAPLYCRMCKGRILSRDSINAIPTVRRLAGATFYCPRVICLSPSCRTVSQVPGRFCKRTSLFANRPFVAPAMRRLRPILGYPISYQPTGEVNSWTEISKRLGLSSRSDLRSKFLWYGRVFLPPFGTLVR